MQQHPLALPTSCPGTAPYWGSKMPKFKNGLAKVGDVYHYCFRINGRYLKGSTRAHDRASAEKVIAEIRRRNLLGAEAIPIAPPTIRELVKIWTENHQNALSAQHVHNIDQITRDWILPTIGDRRVDQVIPLRANRHHFLDWENGVPNARSAERIRAGCHQ